MNLLRRSKSLGLRMFLVALSLYFSPLQKSIGCALATHNVSPVWTWIFSPSGEMMPLCLFVWGVSAALAPVLTLLWMGSLWTGTRKKPFPHISCAALMWLASWGALAVVIATDDLWSLRRAGLEQGRERALPVLAAIEKFNLDKGRYPALWTNLCPLTWARCPAPGWWRIRATSCVICRAGPMRRADTS